MSRQKLVISLPEAAAMINDGIRLELWGYLRDSQE